MDNVPKVCIHDMIDRVITDLKLIIVYLEGERHVLQGRIFEEACMEAEASMPEDEKGECR